MSDRLKALSDAGVSIWLDDLSRERIETGNLADLVKEKSVVGVTTNPTIFAGAIADGERYDDQVRGLVDAGRVRRPGDLRAHHRGRPQRLRHPGAGRRRQLRPTAGSRSRSSRTWPTTPRAPSPRPGPCGRRCDRPNALIKIPATKEGLPAITAAIAEGISVNVTLIFGLERYREVMDAYLTGLEQARDAGLDLASIQSVASFFVSRVDTEVDKRLDADRHRRGEGPQGQGRRRERAAGVRGLRGGHRQRPLAAARGRRRAPPAPAVGLHRREERGLPRHPLRHRARRRRHRQHDAREDDGRLRRPRRGHRRHGDRPRRRRAGRSSTASREVGIDFEDVLLVLEHEGVDKFKKSWTELVETVRGQMEKAGKGQA